MWTWYVLEVGQTAKDVTSCAISNLYKNRWLPKVSLCTPSQKRAVLCKGVNAIEDVVLLDVRKEQQPGRTRLPPAHPHSATHGDPTGHTPKGLRKGNKAPHRALCSICAMVP